MFAIGFEVLGFEVVVAARRKRPAKGCNRALPVERRRVEDRR